MKIFYRYLTPILGLSGFLALWTGLLILWIMGFQIRDLEQSLIQASGQQLSEEVAAKSTWFATSKGSSLQYEILTQQRDFEHWIHQLNVDAPAEVLMDKVKSYQNKRSYVIGMKLMSDHMDIEYNGLSMEGHIADSMRRLSISSDGSPASVGWVYAGIYKDNWPAYWLYAADPNRGLEGYVLYSFRWMEHWISEASGDLQMLAFVVDQEGQLLSFAANSEFARSFDEFEYDPLWKPNVGQQKSKVVESRLVAAYTNDLGMTVFLEIPLDQTLSRVMENRVLIQSYIRGNNRIIILGATAFILLFVSISFVTTYFTTRKLLVPIGQLIRVAQQIGRGEYDVDIGKDRGDEVGALGVAIGKMAEELKKQKSRLIESRNEAAHLRRQIEQQYKREFEEFTYITTHDLKEPLRMIHTYSQLLDKNDDKEGSQTSQYTQMIRESVQKMLHLLDDLHQYALIRSGSFAPHKQSLEDILQESIHRLEDPIRAEGAIIRYRNLPHLSVSRSLMIQLFFRLLTNSIQYRSEKTPVIEVEAIEGDREWIISVKDNGKGIPENYQSTVFEFFKRLERYNEQTGSGLGLTICRDIVHLHGGKIWIVSEEGKGSTLFFTLLKEVSLKAALNAES